MANVFFSGSKPKSSILQAGFTNRLNSFYGFRTIDKSSNKLNLTSLERRTGIKFVSVDLNSPAYRTKQALIGNVFKDSKLSSRLEKYFDSWIEETSLSYDNIAERQTRLNTLYFIYCNDAFLSRTTHLVADEATQLDVQNRLISLESPDMEFVRRTYDLLSQWGVTQARVNAACFDIQLYGECFWSQKITTDGIRKIIPLQPNQIIERLEFSPIKIAEYLARKNGATLSNLNKSTKVQALVDLLSNNKEDALSLGENITDFFENKLLGYEIHDQMFVPPWAITHFRYNADHSEFYPYGRPPMLACISPFQLTLATKTLQGIARAMSLPVTLYKVKSETGMNYSQAFEHVNNVREQYDAVPINPMIASSEVYALNTKIWFPEALLDVEIKESKVDIDFTGDIEMYQDQTIVAAGVPKGYLVQEWGGFGNSAISLVEQFKPFARHVYTVQASFIEGLGELIRLHYAITGEFDYNTPFIISMRFPAEEMGGDKMDIRKGTMELSTSIIELLQSALGLTEEDPLPDDVITDILSKYTFIDPTDLQKWIKQIRINSLFRSASEGDEENEEGGDEEGGGMDFGGDADFDTEGGAGGDLEETGDISAAPEPVAESAKDTKDMKGKKRLRERKLKEHQRLREISQRYKEMKEDIYFKFLEQERFEEFVSNKQHHLLIKPIDENHLLYETTQVFGTERAERSKRLREGTDGEEITRLGPSAISLKEMMYNADTLGNNQEIIDELISSEVEKIEEF